MPSPVFVRVYLHDDAYENDKPAKADTGRGGIRGGGTEPVCVCGVLPFIRG